MVDDDSVFLHYFRPGSESLGFRAILKAHKRARF